MDDQRFDDVTLRLGMRFSRRTGLQLESALTAVIGLGVTQTSDDATAKK